MTLISFNINGIRARLHQLETLLEKYRPTLLGLQETKVQDSEFPEQAVRDLGYHPYYFGQKGHYGVALLTREPLEDVRYGFPNDGEESQRRMIIGRLRDADGKPVTVLNGYFPQGENREHPVKFPAKEKFYQDLQDYLEQYHRPDEQLAIMGDFNISSTDLDIGIGEANRKRWLREGKTSFLPEERAWWQRLVDWGLVDTFRHRHPDTDDIFSWFDYRSRGFERDPRRGLRIDTVLATPALLERLTDTGVDYDIRGMERPSDHCPVWSRFDNLPLMSVHVHLKKLRPGLDSLGFLIDVLMIVLVIVNLALIVFDWVYRVESVQALLQTWVPGFYTFYKERIHANFFEIDLAFVTVYLTEFVIRWGFAIARRTYHRWFFYPFVHWYDLLGCIPVGSFRWLRILRVVSLMFRLQKMGVVDFRDTYLGRTLIKYYKVLMEEISDRVVINVLEGAQREIRTGGPMMHRIEREVLAPRREQLVDYLAGRIAAATHRSHDQYRDRLGEYLVYLTDEAVQRTAAGRRLAQMPVAGPRAIALLGETVRDSGTALVDQLVEDISSPANRPRLDALIDDIISASGGGGEQLNEMVKQTLLEILDHVKAQVAVQHWKEQEDF